MGSLIKPSNLISSSFNEHKERGTTGEDWKIDTGGSTPKNHQFKFPCGKRTKVGTANLNDGTYAEYWNFTSDNGLKFSARTCHCTDYKATGDNYTGSTGYHLHAQFCLGHKTEAWIQENRNGSAFIPFSKIIEEDNKMATKEYKNYFKVLESFEDTTRYYPGVACFKMECKVETHVYTTPELKHYASETPLRLGEKVISRYHSKTIRDGKEWHIHEIKNNQHGVTCYFLYKKEV